MTTLFLPDLNNDIERLKQFVKTHKRRKTKAKFKAEGQLEALRLIQLKQENQMAAQANSQPASMLKFKVVVSIFAISTFIAIILSSFIVSQVLEYTQ